jgi:tetratricopeptide (TPR) repeat protein
MIRKIVLCSVFVSIILLMLGSAVSIPVAAQGPTPTPTLTDQETLNLAKQVADDASSISQNALDGVANANNAVGTSNNALSIALEAYIVGGVLVVLILFLTIRSALHSFREARTDLAQARVRIADMRTTLKTNTEHVHTQAQRAIRGLTSMQLGEHQLSQGNLRGAIQMYEKAAALDPNNRATQYFLGELYVQDDQLGTGIQHLRETLSADLPYAPAEAALGLGLYLQGDQAIDPTERALLYVQAEQYLLAALHTDSTALDLLGTSIQAILAGLYKRQGRIDQAIALYTEAHKITPHDADSIINLAILNTMRGKSPEAQPYFEQIAASTATALVQNAFDEEARINHLLATLALGHTADALADLEIVLRQVKMEKVLAALRDDLNRLKRSPQPPPGVELILEQFITAVSTVKTPA